MYRPSSYASVAAGTASAASTDHRRLHRSTLSALLNQTHSSDDSTYLDVRQPLEIMEPDRSTRYTGDRAGYRRTSNGNDAPKRALDGFSFVSFFTPTYLSSSRYMEKLEAAQKKRLKEAVRSRMEQKLKHAQDSHPSSGRVSRIPSSNNLASMRHGSSHPERGTILDIVERAPHHDLQSTSDDNPSPLPSRWSENNKFPSLVISSDGADVLLKDEVKSSDDAAAVKADHPIPKECGIYYFEITLLSKGMVGIGLSGTRPSVTRLPGWEQDSWGYHGDDGLLYGCSATAGKLYGPTFSEHDVVGCGIDFRTRSIFFTKNGVFLGFPTGDARQDIGCERLYPTIGMKKKNDNVRTNFGQTPFVFDIDSMVANEKRLVKSDISRIITVKDPTFVVQQETEDIQRLVAQYLAHEGYVDTAMEFVKDMQDQRRNLFAEASWPAFFDTINDDSASKRQFIRTAITDGEIDLALDYIGEHYPQVLLKEENRDTYFKLRCRKFTEMVLQLNENQASHTTQNTPDDGSAVNIKATKSQMNGKLPVLPSKMELDGETAFPDDETMSPDLAVVAYGIELQKEFGDDPRPEIRKALNDTFAPIAYSNPADSSLGELMDSKSRLDIAEQVNGAILVSLGKPRDALLNTYCGQTEVLLDMLSTQGGSATLVNVKKDFLQPE